MRTIHKKKSDTKMQKNSEYCAKTGENLEDKFSGMNIKILGKMKTKRKFLSKELCRNLEKKDKYLSNYINKNRENERLLVANINILNENNNNNTSILKQNSQNKEEKKLNEDFKENCGNNSKRKTKQKIQTKSISKSKIIDKVAKNIPKKFERKNDSNVFNKLLVNSFKSSQKDLNSTFKAISLLIPGTKILKTSKELLFDIQNRTKTQENKFSEKLTPINLDEVIETQISKMMQELVISPKQTSTNVHTEIYQISPPTVSPIAKSELPAQIPLAKLTIEEEIKYLMDTLPPIDRSVLLNYKSYNACSCKILPVNDKIKINNFHECPSHESKNEISFQQPKNENLVYSIDVLQDKYQKSIFDIDYHKIDNFINYTFVEPTIKQEFKPNKSLTNLNEPNVGNDTQKTESLEPSISEETQLFQTSLPECEALKQNEKYIKNEIQQNHLDALHNFYIPNVNGNWNYLQKTKEVNSNQSEQKILSDHIVPKYTFLHPNTNNQDIKIELLRSICESTKEASISNSFTNLKEENIIGRRATNGGIQYFREWHEPLQIPSYNEELLTISPYVIID